MAGTWTCPTWATGSITYLPVRSRGARLFIGDAHACQGDGEVCGTAVEYASTTTIKVDLIKRWPIDWPRLENRHAIMSVAAPGKLEDAARITTATWFTGWSTNTASAKWTPICC